MTLIIGSDRLGPITEGILGKVKKAGFVISITSGGEHLRTLLIVRFRTTAGATPKWENVTLKCLPSSFHRKL
jgi:hypothetical protein